MTTDMHYVLANLTILAVGYGWYRVLKAVW